MMDYLDLETDSLIMIVRADLIEKEKEDFKLEQVHLEFYQHFALKLLRHSWNDFKAYILKIAQLNEAEECRDSYVDPVEISKNIWGTFLFTNHTQSNLLDSLRPKSTV